MVCISLSTILSALSLIPAIGPVIKTINAIISVAIPLTGDLTWLINDLQDVCYNYICTGNNETNVCVGQKSPGDYKYCMPKYNDSEIANRDCTSDNNCMNIPSGICTDNLSTSSSNNDIFSNTILHDISGLQKSGDEKFLNFSDFI